MEARGRPTPQRESRRGPRDPDRHPDERPRFRDRLPEEMPNEAANPYLASHRKYDDLLIPASEAWKHRDDWAAVFGRDAPIHLEIGSGNGFFLTGLAERNPGWNVLGVELRYKRVVICATKLRTAGVTNARIIRYHAGFLDDLLPPASIEGLYVNHPDPWPKGRHEKNRLISRWFLEDAARLLKPGGRFRLKSDFPPNVDRVPELLAEEGVPPLPFEIAGTSRDVVRDGAPWPDDIETNYQRKMRIKGVPVLAVDVIRTDAPFPA